MLAPVTDKNAPTVGQLMSQGYLIADGLELGYTCGYDCVGHAFVDVYLAKESTPPGRDTPAEYACPGTDADMDDWKCRALQPPYFPNGGYKLK